ncbi:hypothetical protein B0H13DRAFT_2300973 [Mycena leptocephala]|nr:hypothetical protein B0H13DRAFT_2300973 [Mycena leptocephala]
MCPPSPISAYGLPTNPAIAPPYTLLSQVPLRQMDFSRLGLQPSKPHRKGMLVKREPMPLPKLSSAGAAADFPMDVDKYGFQDRTEMGYVEPLSPLPGPSSRISGGATCMPTLPEKHDLWFRLRGDASNNDYESTHAQRMRRVMHNHWMHPGDQVLLSEEDDEEDEEEFKREAEEEEARRKKCRGKQKAPAANPKGQTKKGKAVTWRADNPGDDTNEDGDEGSKDVPKKCHKAGAVGQVTHQQLFEYKAEFNSKVEALAVKINKLSSVLWSIASAESKQVRQTSMWNMYQRWFYSPNGGNRKADKTGIIRKRRITALLAPFDLSEEERKSTAVILEKLTWLAEWNRELGESILGDPEDSGYRKRGIASVAREATKLSERAYKELNVHVLGQVISINGGSKSFGASPAFQLWKHVLQMELNGTSAAALLQSKKQLQIQWPSHTAYPTQEKEHDTLRKFIKDCLVGDMLAIQVEHGELSVREASSTTLEMKSMSWEEYGFKHNLRIENWDDTMAGRGVWPKKGFNMTKFTIADAHRVVDNDDDEDDSGGAKDSGDESSGNDIPNATKRKGATATKLKAANEEDVLCIVPWTEDEVDIPLEDQANILLITTVDGTMLVRIQGSKKWLQEVAKAQAKTKPLRTRRSDTTPYAHHHRTRTLPAVVPAKNVKGRGVGTTHAKLHPRGHRHTAVATSTVNVAISLPLPPPPVMNALPPPLVASTSVSSRDPPPAQLMRNTTGLPLVASTMVASQQNCSPTPLMTNAPQPPPLVVAWIMVDSQRDPPPTLTTSAHVPPKKADAQSAAPASSAAVQLRLRHGKDLSVIFYGHLNGGNGSIHPADKYTEYNDPDNGWTGLPANWSYTLFLNQQELERGVAAYNREYGANKCTKCHQLIKVYGWGEYSIVEDEVVRSFPVCKACWVYHPYNAGADTFKEAPPCSCPAEAMSGAKTDSGCTLHSLRFDVFPQKLVPHPHVDWIHGRGYDKLDAAVGAWHTCLNASRCPMASLRPLNNLTARCGVVAHRLDSAPVGGQPFGSSAAGDERRRALQVAERKKESLVAEENFFNY